MRFRKPVPPPEASVLFVCLGNICRSPTAEGVFRLIAQRAGIAPSLQIDSAGLGNWYVGSPPDPRAQSAARRRGYDLSGLRARQVGSADFQRFGWILAMDESNLRGLQSLRPADFVGHLGLFLDVAPELATRELPDPYYGSPEAFEHVLDLTEVAANALLARVRSALPAD